MSSMSANGTKRLELGVLQRARLVPGNGLASTSQRSPIPSRGINQPAFISCVREGADKLVALQSNFQGLPFNPRICPWCAGIYSGGN
jgi:hypothetical protein